MTAAIVINGVLVHDRGAAEAGFIVEAWDDDGVWPDLVDCAVTGADGRFTMSLASEYLVQVFDDRGVRLYFRVFRDQTPVADTRGGLVWTPAAGRAPMRITVGGDAQPSRARLAPFVVRGRVFDEQRRPLSAGRVRLLRRRLAEGGLRDDPLADATIGADGSFRVEYESPDHRKLDLIVTSYDAGGTALAKVLYGQAPASLIVDIMPTSAMRLPAWPGPSVLEQRLDTLRPILGRRSVADLDDRESEYVASATKVERADVRRLRDLDRRSRDTGVAVEVLAALDHAGLPTEPEALLGRRRTALVEAVQRAVAANAVPASVNDRLDDQLNLLLDRVVEHALRPAATSAQASVGDVLRTSGVPERHHAPLLRRYLDRDMDRTDAEFWAELTEDAEFGPAVVTQMRFALHLAILTDGDASLLSRLGHLRDQGRLSSAADLADLDQMEWERLLHDAGIVPAEDVPRRAAQLLANVELSHPGRALLRRLARPPEVDLGLVDNSVRTAAARVLANLGQPDLHVTRLRRMVTNRGDAAFDGVDHTVRQAALDQILAIQRVFRVASPAQVEPLLAAGFRTARSIAQAPQAHFVRQNARALGGTAAARAVHNQAVVYSGGITTGLRTFMDTYAGLMPYVIGGPYVLLSPSEKHKKLGEALPPAVKDGAADWPTLFGSLALCECGHCRSVYSPAAYLADLLYFLGGLPAGPGPQPLAALRARRPDLMALKLTCENTNTPLPYVDLVNEALESYIQSRFINQSSSGTTAAYDTGTASAEELRAVPQNVLDTVYDHLQTSNYPVGLPFHRPLAIARAYLHHLGVSRCELMEAYQTPATPGADAIAAESLGLSPEEFSIIAGTDPAAVHEFYGFTQSQSGTSWLVTVAKVPEMLDRTGLEFTDLMAVLRTWFVNRNQSIANQSILISMPSVNCDVSLMTLTGLDVAGADRLHRFVRLWRGLNREQPGRPAVGWSIGDLDRALLALNASTLDVSALRRLDAAQRGVVALRRPLVEVLSLWADLDTWGTDALYLRLFHNRAVLEADKVGALELHYHPGAGPDVRDTQTMPYLAAGHTLGTNIAAVLAGARLTEPDLRLVMKREGLTDSSALTVTTMSRILRYSVLSRATRLRISELLAMLHLCGEDPFGPADPAGLLAFLAHRQRLADSGMKVAVLDYVCRGVADPLAGVAPTPNEVGNALTALRAALLAVVADTAMPAEDPTHDALTAKLGSIVAPEAVEPLKALLLGETQGYPANPSAFVAANLGLIVDPAQAMATLALSSPPLTPEQQQANITWLLGAVRAYRARDVVVATLASALRLDPPVVTLLLDSLLLGRVVDGEPAMADYLALVASDPAPGHTVAYELAHKAALLIRGIGLTERELAHVHAFPSQWDAFSLNELPLAEVDDPTAAKHFARWARLADLAALRDRLPHGERTLIDVFEHDVSAEVDPMAALVTDLAAVTGWPSALVTTLVGPTGLALGVPDLRTERRLLDLERCLAVAGRLGVNPSLLFGWTETTPTPTAASEVVGAVKAHYDERAWLEVAQTLNDELRERQRDALVAFLLPRTKAGHGYTTEDLYGDLLIDIEMSACMLTSRVKQAISSAQLFVQRCLLGLEDVGPHQIDAEQWRWRKNYRVWEANRKVFLYPENWIRPELDRDRTPFFRELETGLLQADPTNDHVESVYLRYLEQLDDVARLKVVGVYHHNEDETDVFHIIASTIDGEPRAYYYRRFLNRREWTPWERIDLDIPSDHVVPVVFNRRLHLFWFILTPKPVEGLVYADGYEGPPLQTYEITLAWSEYRRGKWAPRRTAGPRARVNQLLLEYVVKQGIVQGDVDPLESSDGFTVVVTENAEQLILGLYEHRSDSKEFSERGRLDLYFTVNSYRSAVRVEVVASDLSSPPGSEAHTYDFAVPSHAAFGAMAVIRSSGGLTIGGDGFYWPILGKTSGYCLVRQGTADLVQPPKKLYPFALSDDRRQYFAFPYLGPMYAELAFVIWLFTGSDVSKARGQTRLRFVTLQHPYTGDFIKALSRDGLDGLLALNIQGLTKDNPMNDFLATYTPKAFVADPLPSYRVDFDPEGSYSRYNWELFLHAPMLIADRLVRDGRFDEARRFMHFIFDPTTDDPDPAPARFWRLLPFRETTALERAQELMELLAYEGEDADLSARRQAVVDQVTEWTNHPFEPHRIARLRLVAYQKYVVMAYLDCVLAQADSLFRRDTIELNNEAAQLYILALEIVKRPPPLVPLSGTVKPRSYDELVQEGLGPFANAAVELESVVPPFTTTTSGVGSSSAAMSILPPGDTLYFCTPENDKLRGYWDQIEDRLFKLRHCLNIEGQVRQLPLFEPPIDPAALVRAVAAGLDLGAAASDLFAPPSRFRFTYLVAKANELCAELKSLGSLLLAALEKGDAETLADLRTSQEVALLKAVRAVREQQVKEAQHAYDALRKTEETTRHRRDFYAGFEHRIDQEKEQVSRMEAAQTRQELANLAETAVAAAAQIPNVTVGSSGSMGSPVLTATFGGSNAVAGLQTVSRILSWMAGYESYKANMAGLEAGWARRDDDVKLQEDLANKELAQIAKQVAAAQARVTITETELSNHDMQIEQAGEVANFLRAKFTNTELYQWMAAQLSAIYHQAYKLAFDVAKRAERAYRFEHGLTSSAIVTYSWEGGRKGLLAAERLSLDLKRLETAWMDAAPPPYEITKHVSLVLHDPAALIELKRTGSCLVELPETLYDADHPGHYSRRMRSLRVTIPCVTGPYTSINCKVTMDSNRERVSTSLATGYQEAQAGSDSRFRYDFASTQSIVTSHGRGDAGRFALGADPSTYLPFEGAGAICRLSLELPRVSNGFDFDTISDVVLTVEYTSREGGIALRDAAQASLMSRAALVAKDGGLTPPLQRLFSARHEFGPEWHKFLQPAAGASQVLTLAILPEHFPYAVRDRDLSIRQIDLLVQPKDGASIVPNGVTVTLSLPDGTQPAQPVAVNLPAPAGPGLPTGGSVAEPWYDENAVELDSVAATGKWTLTVPGVPKPTFAPKEVEDIIVLMTYTIA